MDTVSTKPKIKRFLRSTLGRNEYSFFQPVTEKKVIKVSIIDLITELVTKSIVLLDPRTV